MIGSKVNRIREHVAYRKLAELILGDRDWDDALRLEAVACFGDDAVERVNIQRAEYIRLNTTAEEALPSVS